MEKEEKVAKKQTKEIQEKKHIGWRLLGIILVMCVTIFIIILLRRFFILNTYAIAMAEYSKKDNYSITLYENQPTENSIISQSYYKDGKKVFILQPSENKKMHSYCDKEQWIVKIDNDQNKVALVSKKIATVTGPVVVSAFGEGMSAWQNFLLSFTTQITEEECNGKDCYKVDLDGMQVWIDKETYLTARIANGYLQNSDGTKELAATNYEYKFGTVTDAQVAKPDLTGYSVREQK